MTAGDGLGTLSTTFGGGVGDCMSGGEQGVHNRMGGRVETAVQARDVQCGVHFHGREHVLSAPRQIPAPSRHFTNQVRVLAAADRALAATGEDGPAIVVFRGAPG
jgi:hypothetical protein